jgi:tetratricopeptide (TPR) repeat protein
MGARALAARITETTALVAALAERAPPASSAPALDELFHTLATAETARERVEAEDLIWALWHAHQDTGLARRMNKAIGALARRELTQAQALLDALVLDAPGWAEAWNKRATALFLKRHDEASVRDIRRTLELEPRHFGALCGFGQICLRAGDEGAALIAFQAALRVNPTLDAVRETLTALERKLRRTMH